MNIQFNTTHNNIRLAFPVPISPEIKGKLGGENWMVDLFGNDVPPELKAADVQAVSPGFIFSLPKIFKVTPSDIIEIPGKKPFVVTFVDPPKAYKSLGMVRSPEKKQQVINHPTRGAVYWPGEVGGFDVATGDIVKFNDMETVDAVIAAINAKKATATQETLTAANEKIDAYNKKIVALDSATKSFAQLPLQLGLLQNEIKNRISTLDSIIANTQQKLAESGALLGKEDGPVKEWAAYVDQMIQSANLSEQDFVDGLFFKYMYKYDQLVVDLEANKIPMPTGTDSTLKDRLVALAKVADQKYKAHLEDLKLPSPETDFSILDRETPEIAKLEESDIPNQRGVTGYGSFDSLIKSLKRTLFSCNENKQELQSIGDAIAKKLQEMSSLPEGFRSNKNLSETPEGQKFVKEQITWWDEALGVFVRKYATEIIDKKTGGINKKLFGSKGTSGNALVAIVAQHVYAVGKNLLNKLLFNMNMAEQKQSVPTQEQVSVPQA